MSACRPPRGAVALFALALAVTSPARAQDATPTSVEHRLLGPDTVEGAERPSIPLPAPSWSLWTSFLELPQRDAAIEHVRALRARRLTLSVRAIRIDAATPLPDDDAVLDGATLDALRRALRDGTAAVVHHTTAIGGLDAPLVARDEHTSAPVVRREQESAVGAAMNFARTYRVTSGLRADVRLTPHAAGGYLAAYRLLWADPPRIETTRTSGVEVSPFRVVQRSAEGEVRVAVGETLAVRFTAPDGTREWLLLELAGPPHRPATAGGRTPLGDGLHVLDTAHLWTAATPGLPWIDDTYEELFDERDPAEPPKSMLWRLLDAFDTSWDGEVEGPHGLTFASTEGADAPLRPLAELDALLERSARIRGVRAVARVEGGGARVEVPTAPASPFAGARLEVESTVCGQEGLAGCNDCLVWMPLLQARSTGIGAAGRLRVDGTLELVARAETRVASAERTLQATRMLAGYGATEEVPFDRVDQTRRVLAVRTWVPFPAEGDQVHRLADGLAAAAVFPPQSGLPRDDVVHLVLDRRTEPFDGVALAPDSVGLDTGADRPVGLRSFRLAGFDLAAPDGAAVEAADLREERVTGGLRRDGWCGMTLVVPEAVQRRGGVLLRARLRDVTADGLEGTADVSVRSVVLEPGPVDDANTPDRRAERVLEVAFDDLPLVRDQELAAWGELRIRLTVPGLPAALPPVQAQRRLARLTLPDGSTARFLFTQDEPLSFRALRRTRRPLDVDLSTSNHQSAHLMADWRTLEEGVELAVEEGPLPEAPALHVDVYGPASVAAAAFSQRVFPPRTAPPLVLDTVQRARTRRLLVVDPESGLDFDAGPHTDLPWRLVVTPEPPPPTPSEEDDR